MTGAGLMTPTRRRLVVALLFVVGGAVRLADMRRVPGTDVLQSWREGDIATIARNYVREDMNLFEPRIDWRGDGNGLAEMEFPIFPWLIALSYKLLGVHPILGRALVWIAAMATFALFWRMARDLLPDFAALLALGFFALAPTLVRISSSLQAEGLMMFFYLLAVQGFLRWLREDTWKTWLFGSLSLSMAILAKLPAAHLGLLFAVLILRAHGWKVLLRPRVWGFVAIALVPSIAWYAWAHRYYELYGNSLGLSNMHHWLTWDVLTDPAYWKGLLDIELHLVWMPPGLLVAGIGIAAFATHPATRVAVTWLAAIAIYFVVTLRTNGSPWAAYYHVVVVPPAALLIGLGGDACSAWLIPRERIVRIAWSIAAAGVVVGFVALAVRHDPTYVKVVMVGGSLVVAARLLPILHDSTSGAARDTFASVPWRLVVGVVGAVALTASFLLSARNIYWEFRRTGQENLHACAESFAPYIPEDSLIVVSGFHRVFPGGYVRPYNASYFFFWLDRKGWNIAIEDQNLPFLESLISRGGRYYVAEKGVLEEQPGWESTLRATFPVLDECDDAVLFDLRRR